ncbi:hypothetical protein CAL7716_099750 (plasmid) [Calothrix sp. PCC 7716]|nr:hypothetical protein CAL7716_099750 [Calothrix sp. PCC 7716]
MDIYQLSINKRGITYNHRHDCNSKLTPGAEKLQLLWLVFSLRSSLFFIELGVGLCYGSLSLLAGSGHLFTDMLTLGLTLLAVWLTQRQSSGEANLTYQQVEVGVGLLNGLSLIFLAVFTTWEAVKHLYHPEPISGLPTLIVAFLSLVINGLSVDLLHEHSHQDLNLRGVTLHGIADASNSIGVIVATSCVYFFNWLWADAVASLLLASFLSVSAVSLIKASLQKFRLTRNF